MSEREEFEKAFLAEFEEGEMPLCALNFCPRQNEYTGSESDEYLCLWNGRWEGWQARAQHCADLTQIAKSKIDQMGGTICGLLVRNEAGALAAVSDLGRVTWLDGADSGEAVHQWQVRGADHWNDCTEEEYKRMLKKLPLDTRVLCTKPQPPQGEE